jgi:hypothetical protein
MEEEYTFFLEPERACDLNGVTHALEKNPILSDIISMATGR